MTRTEAVPAPEAQGERDTAALLAALGVDPAEGLSPAEAAGRLARHGRNRMRERRARGALAILALQFRGIIVWLLTGAAALSFAVGDYPEAVAIAVVLVLNAAIGFFTELRALRSIEALYRIAEVRTRVRRGGVESLIDARDLVPGDIVLLEAGDIVTADLRLIEGAGIEADQSVLTGESVPVAKDIAPPQPGTPAAERADSLFKGSAITHGSGETVVAATGMSTELGRITRLVEAAEPVASPLERRLAELGRWLVWVTLALAGATAGAGILRGRDPTVMAETAIALAVAAVPEGLPVVATLCLARGLLRILRKNALVTRLSAVETLGAVTVILTDKTGTLTENRMTVRRFLLPEGDTLFVSDPGEPEAPGLRRALEVGVLCSNATLDGERGDVGDPMELALLQAGRVAGMERAALLQEHPEEADHAFDQRLRMMATVHARQGGHLIAVKGAPEAVIPVAVRAGESGIALTEADRAAWLERARAAAGQGFRVLGLAWKESEGAAVAPYEGLTLAGLVCLADPLRPDVPVAIAACRRAGIRVVMLTGDHADTAAAIAREAGLADNGVRVIEGSELGDPAALAGPGLERALAAEVFARISPEQKLELARLFQRRGEIVAMTGDGVNDAPSLKQADIGIAMGGRGTEVARQAAPMVLKDDRFPTIVTAVREGRIIFDNIRRFVLYLMSCNVSEVLLVGLAVAAGLPTPLLPLQILYLNLVTDVFPAFAVGLGRGSGGVMQRPPRPPAEPIVDGRHWGRIAALGVLLTAAAMGTFVFALADPRWSEGEAVTIAFLTLALAQLWNVFNLRGVGAGLIRNSITLNPYVWAALAICLVLLAAALWLPGLSRLMELPSPGAEGLALALGGSLVPLVLWQGWLGLSRIARGRS
ncbi:MAG: cation-transporting P-type ATPase [Paracoccaceae bacterium]|nr:cation-transporting P-type ATPase [Paracoccaceae bacterium]